LMALANSAKTSSGCIASSWPQDMFYQSNFNAN
jgi:hypothetical protein